MRDRHHRRGLNLGLVVAAVLLAGCPNPPQPPPSPDASDASPAPPTPTPGACAWDAACAALKGASCPLGAAADCSTSLARDIGSGKVANVATGKPLTCHDIAAVRTKADAVRLGFACQ